MVDNTRQIEWFTIEDGESVGTFPLLTDDDGDYRCPKCGQSAEAWEGDCYRCGICTEAQEHGDDFE
jgi:hypothetical protein